MPKGRFPKIRAALLAALLAGASTAVLGAQANAAPPVEGLPPAPENDPFYDQPAQFPDVAPGTILDSRESKVRAFTLPLPFRAWQVKYASRDAQNRPIAAVATVIQPENGPPPGNRKLVSYQTAEDSLTTACAPSFGLSNGLGAHAAEVAATIPLLAKGHTVVVPDYEGPNSEWGAGQGSGRGVLDGIRAAQDFSPAGLSGAKTQTVMWGYSGGALASQWANELQPSYAPELRIVGVAAGGIPADLEYVARRVDGGPLSGVYIGAATGLARAYSDRIDSDKLLNDRGKRAFREVGGQCIELFAPTQAFKKMSDYTTVPQLLDVPEVKQVIRENTMGQHEPGAPMYFYQGAQDELTFVQPVDELVQKYCAAGKAVRYERGIGDHFTMAGTGVPGALDYLSARLDGKPAPSNCQS